MLLNRCASERCFKKRRQVKVCLQWLQLFNPSKFSSSLASFRRILNGRIITDAADACYTATYISQLSLVVIRKGEKSDLRESENLTLWFVDPKVRSIRLK